MHAMLRRLKRERERDFFRRDYSRIGRKDFSWLDYRGKLGLFCPGGAAAKLRQGRAKGCGKRRLQVHLLPSGGAGKLRCSQ